MPDPQNKLRYEQLGDAVRTDTMVVHVETPAATTYNLSLGIPYGAEIDTVRYKLNAGTCTIAVRKNGSTTLLGAATRNITTTAGSETPATTLAAEDTIELVVTSPSSASGLTVQLDITRTT